MTEGFPGGAQDTGTEGVQRFRKRPAVIEAMRWEGGAAAATPVIDWILGYGGTARYHEGEPSGAPAGHIVIDTLEGTMAAAAPGDWIIRGIAGEFYSCRGGIFTETYDLVTEGGSAEPPAEEPSLPEGIYGRVELPGMRSDTGWITEGMRGGQTVLVVRDWNGCPLGEYILGPACRLVHLPTPLKRPETQERAAITSGRGWDEDDDWERNPF